MHTQDRPAVILLPGPKEPQWPARQRTAPAPSVPREIKARPTTLMAALAVAFLTGIGASQKDWSFEVAQGGGGHKGPAALMFATAGSGGPAVAFADEDCESGASGCDPVLTPQPLSAPLPEPVGSPAGSSPMAGAGDLDYEAREAAILAEHGLPRPGDKDYVPAADLGLMPEKGAEADAPEAPEPEATPAPAQPEVAQDHSQDLPPIEPLPVTPEDTAPVDTGPDLASDDGSIYMECSKVGDALECDPISVSLLAENAVQSVSLVDTVVDMVPTGRVDRDVADHEGAIHDPHQEAPDPYEVMTYGPIERGDTVLDIAKRHFDLSQHNVYDAAAAIVRENPHAFQGGDPNNLMIGTVVEIPDPYKIAQGSWGSLIKTAQPQEIHEERHRRINGIDATDMILNVEPQPLTSSQDLAQTVHSEHPVYPGESRSLTRGGTHGGRDRTRAAPQANPEPSRTEEAQVRRQLQAVEAQLRALER